MTKKTIFLIVFFVFLMVLKSFGQLQRQKLVHDKYVINYALIDGVDLTKEYMLMDAFITFFYLEDDERILFMANICPNAESMSYGAMLLQDFRKFDKVEEFCAMDFYQFDWYYLNTYDEDSGVAEVRFIIFYYPEGTQFSMEILLEDSQRSLIFKGFLDNDVFYNEEAVSKVF